MKKNILMLGMAAALLTTSCSDFLDVQPEGTPSADQYFKNDQQAIDAVDGLYYEFSQEDIYGRNLFYEQAAAGDIVWGRPRDFNTLATLGYTGDESPTEAIFNTMYAVMARSNWVIEGLLDKRRTTALSAIEDRSLGEAYFTRAWAHFLVAYRYGLDTQGVPFVRYEDFPDGYDNSIPPQRESVMEDYRLIVEDLDSAASHLPRFEDYDEADRGRAHKAAAVALKAKVYAYWATWDESRWNDVIRMVDELERDYHRDLAPSLDTVFSSEYADFWNDEYLWSIPSDGGTPNGGTEFPGVVLENKGWGLYNGWGYFKPTEDIYEEMLKDGDDNDRLRRSILAYGQEFQFFGETRRFYSTSDNEAGFQINKYMDPFKHSDPVGNGYVSANGDYPTARINFPIIRFAEMLLFRAEAYLMTNQARLATADINRIRVRSHLAPLDHVATMADLYHERRCELAFEFTDHLFDLKRWHRSSNAEIRALAEKELNSHPRVRHYADRLNPNSTFTVEPYDDYPNKTAYDDHLMVFPYPSNQIVNSNGQLKQNPGY